MKRSRVSEEACFSDVIEARKKDVETACEDVALVLKNEINFLTRKIECLIAANRRHERHLLRETRERLSLFEKEFKKIEENIYVDSVEEGSKTLLQLYNKIRDPDERVSKTTRRASAAALEKKRQAEKDVSDRRSSIVNKFLSNEQVQPPAVEVVQDDASCRCCGSENILTISAKSTLTCQDCGYSFIVLDANSSTLNLGDDVNFSQTFSYLRSNHFNDCLLRIQGKESYVVPQETINEVMEALYENEVHPDEVNNKTVLAVMKKNKMKSKTYKHTTQIVSRISGRPPPRLSSEHDNVAKLIFSAIQEPFARHCPPERKIFLSYSYVVYRILELLGCDELLDSISLLSGKGKISSQDAIMEKIYKDLDLEWPGPLEEG